MKREGSTDLVGEARVDLAWQHVITAGSSNQYSNLQEAKLTGFVTDNSGLIARFIRGRSLRSGVCND